MTDIYIQLYIVDELITDYLHTRPYYYYGYGCGYGFASAKSQS